MYLMNMKVSIVFYLSFYIVIICFWLSSEIFLKKSSLVTWHCSTSSDGQNSPLRTPWSQSVSCHLPCRRILLEKGWLLQHVSWLEWLQRLTQIWLSREFPSSSQCATRTSSRKSRRQWALRRRRPIWLESMIVSKKLRTKERKLQLTCFLLLLFSKVGL